MIQLKKADKQFLASENIENEAYICTDNEAILGICEYSLKDNELFITSVNCEDNSLADGLIRQTMNNALDCGYNICKFTKEVAEKMYELRIIKEENAEEIDILDFFLKLNCI